MVLQIMSHLYEVDTYVILYLIMCTTQISGFRQKIIEVAFRMGGQNALTRLLCVTCFREYKWECFLKQNSRSNHGTINVRCRRTLPRSKNESRHSV